MGLLTLLYVWQCIIPHYIVLFLFCVHDVQFVVSVLRKSLTAAVQKGKARLLLG